MGRRRVTREFKLEAAASATLGAGTANRRSDQDIVLTTSVQWLGCCVRLESVAMSAPARRKDDVIQIRTSAEAKAILNRAATLRGQKLSEFMLQSARRQAEETILDQRTFFLDADAHRRFLAQLDSSPAPSAKARARLNRKAPWHA